MKLEKNSITLPFRSTEVHRPWGYYGLYSDNEPCTSKILYVKKNETISLQYHFKRDQFYLLLDDSFRIEYSTEKVDQDKIVGLDDDARTEYFHEFLKNSMVVEESREGDMFGFESFVLHRAVYTGDREYGRILDIAFGENDEGDIVRVSDKYGR